MSSWPHSYSPQELLRCLGCHVTITLTTSATIRGHLYSVDPLTFAVLLLKENTTATFVVVKEHAILAFHSACLNMGLLATWKSEAFFGYLLYLLNHQIPPVHKDVDPMPRNALDRAITVDTADFAPNSPAMQERKQALIDLFTTQHLPIQHTPADASLRILDCARIEPPYVSTSVVCDNEVVLQRVREIVMRV
ncbi:hypothetical protein BC938DRAFT_481760 [Jimgerdemannia flammicorona]|uniref:AD domain-containing protein n=1 Tax=Jimgerdemannia flammicorona TaxID=994334 RepID=A0A433QFG0_9FUNG|nr:hypothetical protein BC938DRAFT_481760 [Jimgerdemannia flammicorona]